MIFIASFLSGICASLGIGGGVVLLLYLTTFLGVAQKEAGLLNLIFFIPIAILSIIMHSKNKLIKFDVIPPCIIGGIFGILLGVWFNSFISNDILSKIFGVFLIIFGIKLLFTKSQA